LYKGVKIKDNLGKITDRFESKKLDFLKDLAPEANDFSVPDVDEGIFGVIISLILWFIMAIIISYLFWAFGVIMWISILTFIAMLYWIFFRALRLVFKKSSICKASYSKSISYGFGFTILYNFWIYIIIFMTVSLF
jgi:uncharacterized protein YacL